MIFIDLEKAHDGVPNEALWKEREKKGAWVAYIRTIKDMYGGAKTNVRAHGGTTKYFHITIGLYQG